MIALIGKNRASLSLAIGKHGYTNRDTNIYANRYTNRDTNRDTNRYTNRYTNRDANRDTNRDTNILSESRMRFENRLKLIPGVSNSRMHEKKGNGKGVLEKFLCCVVVMLCCCDVVL